MKKYKGSIILISVIAVMLYLAIGFIQMTFNPMDWHIVSRVIYAGILFFLVIFEFVSTEP